MLNPLPMFPNLKPLVFSRRYDLDQRFFLNIEENHATLAGKSKTLNSKP
jgi:xylose isomerase